jgi:hypothetical protein
MEAIQQAVREPLSQAPHDYQKFAIYIFERAREIDREKALAEQSSCATMAVPLSAAGNSAPK